MLGCKKKSTRLLFSLIISKKSANRPHRHTNQPAKYNQQHSDEKLNTANRTLVVHSHV
jgi:hypothetical protein